MLDIGPYYNFFYNLMRINESVFNLLLIKINRPNFMRMSLFSKDLVFFNKYFLFCFHILFHSKNFNSLNFTNYDL
jgi:hypothetical protein